MLPPTHPPTHPRPSAFVQPEPPSPLAGGCTPGVEGCLDRAAASAALLRTHARSAPLSAGWRAPACPACLHATRTAAPMPLPPQAPPPPPALPPVAGVAAANYSYSVLDYLSSYTPEVQGKVAVQLAQQFGVAANQVSLTTPSFPVSGEVVVTGGSTRGGGGGQARRAQQNYRGTSGAVLAAWPPTSIASSRGPCPACPPHQGRSTPLASPADFPAGAQPSVQAGLVAYLNVSASAANVTTVSSSAARRKRRLLAATATMRVQVAAANGSQAVDVEVGGRGGGGWGWSQKGRVVCCGWERPRLVVTTDRQEAVAGVGCWCGLRAHASARQAGAGCKPLYAAASLPPPHLRRAS